MGDVAMLELDVLVKGTLGPIGLLALFVGADIVAGNFACGSSHPFLLLFSALAVFGVGVVLYGRIVGMGLEATYNPEFELAVAFLG